MNNRAAQGVGVILAQEQAALDELTRRGGNTAPLRGDVGSAAGLLVAGMTLEQVIATCKAHGVRRISYGGVELDFGSAGPAVAPSPEDLLKTAQALAGAMPSDAEMLGWSAPEFPQDLAELAGLVGLESWNGLSVKKQE